MSLRFKQEKKNGGEVQVMKHVLHIPLSLNYLRSKIEAILFDIGQTVRCIYVDLADR